MALPTAPPSVVPAAVASFFDDIESTAADHAAAIAASTAYQPGGTDVAVADGGTGASTASAARTNLGLVIGTNVQAWDADLDAVAAAGNGAVLAATTASFLTADETKLDGIEALADVTDATNVAAAGAVMESDTTTALMSFVVDEDNMVSDSATKVPTQQSTKAYADTKAPLASPTFTGLPTGPQWKSTGVTGADTTPLTLSGANATGAPASGAHVKGEIAGDDTGKLWYCTVAGTPGTWVDIGASGVVSDAVYGVGWDGDTTTAPSKNAVYDKIEDIVASGGVVSDTAYGAGWDGDTTVAPSKNAVYDKIESLGGGSFDPDVNMPWHVIVDPRQVPDTTIGTWSESWHAPDSGLKFANGGSGLAGGLSQNDEVAWDVVLAAGTWDVTLHHRKSTNVGIYTVTVDGSSIGTVDGYAAAAAAAATTISGVSVATTGKKRLKFKMATKNASSSDYVATIHKVTLRRTA